MNSPLITLHALSKQYRLTSGKDAGGLHSVSMDIQKGEFVAIMGPSGSGKTTLMNMLGILDRPTDGRYLLEGEEITHCTDIRLARIRNLIIGFIFQGFNLLPRRTILDNIALPLIYAGIGRDERMERAKHLLAQVGLASHRDHMPGQLSGGQQQRIAIARALIGNPRLILADEPTGNLDSETAKDIMELFCALHKEGNTIILVTHEPEIARYATRLIKLKDGKIVYDDLTSGAL